MVIAAFFPQIPKIGKEAIGTERQGQPAHEKHVPNGLNLPVEYCVQGLAAHRLSFQKDFDFERIDGAEDPKNQFQISYELSNFISRLCSAKPLLPFSQHSSKDPISAWRNEQKW